MPLHSVVGDGTANSAEINIARMGPFELLSDGSELPVFAFRLRDPGAAGCTVFDLSERVRQRAGSSRPTRFPRTCRTRRCR